MAQLCALCDLLDAFAPSHLAEEWDNTGLLLGDRAADVTAVMTCLTLTPDVAEEAVTKQAGLVVTHHPLPFRPLARITADSVEGAVLWRLARAGVAVYSPHTSFDSTLGGINAGWAEALGLAGVAPLVAAEPDAAVGAGRVGALAEPMAVEELAARVRAISAAASVRLVAPEGRRVQQVAVACGSGGSFIPAAIAAGADVLVTGEATFHNCLTARSAGLALVLPGHYASERFAVERLAGWLAQQSEGLTVWASAVEIDPLRTL